MTTAEKLRAQLTRHRMKPAALAKELEVPRSTVATWLAGTGPRLPMLRRVADVFGVKFTYLLGDE